MTTIEKTITGLFVALAIAGAMMLLFPAEVIVLFPPHEFMYSQIGGRTMALSSGEARVAGAIISAFCAFSAFGVAFMATRYRAVR